MSNTPYRQILPSTELADYVNSFWEFKNVGATAINTTIVPDGFFKIVAYCQDDKIEQFFLTGLWPQETEITVPAGATIYGVRFKLLAPEFILNTEIAHLLQTRLDIDSNDWGTQAFQGNGLESFVEQMETSIRSRLEKSDKVQSKKLKLSQLLDATQGEISTEEIAKQIAWSNRQINRYLNRFLGVSLKRYLSIKRCYQALIDIREGKLFPEKGYYDQAHFIKDIKKHTSHTPKDLYKGKNDRFLQLRDISKP